VRTAKMQEELEIARRIQTSILPSDPALDGLEIAAAMVPADDVGGDYYDVQPAFDGGWITIGDVSGHGLDAGLVMMMVQSAASAISAARASTSPSELLALLNGVLYDNIARRLSRRDYVTLTVLRYLRSGRVTFAGAHQDILVYRQRSRSVERILTPGPWLGIRRQIRNVTVDSTFDLEDQDVMVLFTDGVTESMDAAGELFDIDRLCRAIEATGDREPSFIRDHVISEVKRWGARQDDDVTLFVARYSAPGSFVER